MKFLLPPGVGDSLWALMLVRSIRDRHFPGDPRIDVQITCSSLGDPPQQRALEMVRRFSFVTSAEMLVTPLVRNDRPQTDELGFPNYVPNGWDEAEQRFTIIPNDWLDRGKRLEEGMPEYKVDWKIFESFPFFLPDFAVAHDLLKTLCGQRFCAIYAGPLAANTIGGFNRGAIWTPEDWLAVVTACVHKGIIPVFVGASYDRSYYEEKLLPLLGPIPAVHSGFKWIDLIGKTSSLAEVFYLCTLAEFVISFASGIGIAASYLGARTVFFFLAYGDSCYPTAFFSPHDNMTHSWVNPEHLFKGNHIGLVYGPETQIKLIAEMMRREWL